MTDPQTAPNPLETLLNPRSIVVAGASNNFFKMGSIQAMNLLSSGYAGGILFLHPRAKEVLGRPAYRTPDDLPYPPDMAMLVTPAKVTVELIEGLGRCGVKHAVIISAGFKEVGGEGVELENRLVSIAERYGMRFLGPNCLGIINTHVGLNLTVFPYRDRPGKLGLISQSGTYVAQIMPYLRERGIRYSQAISVGNAANIDLVDCLDYLGDDPNTGAIALYIEGISRGREFLECARRVSSQKPIVALYVGGSGAGSRSSLSHTGSMGGPDRLYDGLFEQAGVIRASNLEQLFGWTHALATQPIPKGDRIGILTHSGGPATSMADACERAGLSVPEFSSELEEQIRALIEPQASPRNPIDLTFTLEHDSFIGKIPELLFASDEIDAVLVHGMMDTGIIGEIYPNFRRIVSASKDALEKAIRFDLERLIELPAQSGKPLVASNFFHEDHGAQTFRDNDIPIFRSPEAAVEAMAALVRYGTVRRRLEQSEGHIESSQGASAQQTPRPSPTSSSPIASRTSADSSFQASSEKLTQTSPLATGEASSRTAPAVSPTTLPPGVMDEFEAKQLLASYGIPTTREQRITDLVAGLSAADEIGYPVVLKGLAPQIAHKTEAGLVNLDLRGPAEFERAWKKIEEVAPGCPRLVAQMLRGDRELLVGMTRFEGFGPCVMLGIGGVFTEAIDDATFRIAPVTFEEALRMPDSLKLDRLFAAQRNLEEIDRATLALIIQAVGRLALEHPEISEIDINPLVVVTGRPIAVDALVAVGSTALPPTTDRD